MKTRVSGVKIMKFFGVIGLVACLWLVATFGSPGKRAHQLGVGSSLRVASEVSRLARVEQGSRRIENYGKLSLSFVENQGQTAREVRYVSHGSGYELFLTPQEADLALRGPVRLDLSPKNRFATLRALREARRAHRSTMTAFVRMHLEGANPEPQMVGTNQLPGNVNYFIGNDPKKWHTNVPTYGRVKYVGVYPGVDLVFYGNQRRLEYDFIVAPGADPNVIALKVDGARKMRITRHGDMVLTVPGGEVVLQKPLIYQQVKGERHEISGKYALSSDHRVTFSVAEYDRNEPLVLDPVLNYSTYLGGSGDDEGIAIAVDTNKNAFVTGTTLSIDFPTPASVNGFQKGPLASNVGGAAFVTEIDPTGTTLLYSTYIAGSTPGEIAFGIALDSSDKIYITGQTLSTDFPTASTVAGFNQSPNLGNVNGTGFITKLDPTLTGSASLVYSSYLGGTDGTIGDLGQSVAVADASGLVYVVGLTDSSAGTSQSNFRVVNGFQTALSNAAGNAFLAKIDTTVSTPPVYSTYLGGNAANPSVLGVGDAAFGVAADTSGNAYLVGTTSSTDLITTLTPAISGFQSIYPVGNVTNTAFVSRIDTTKTGAASLAYLTYLGGADSDFGDAIALGPTNIAYVTGQANSPLFPIFPVAPPPGGPFQPTKGASGVAFVSVIDTTSNANPSYSTFLGGTGGDEGLAIRVDGPGNAYIAGKTSSNNFPVSQGAFQPKFPAGASGNGFVSEVNPGGNGSKDLIYSTYFGGSGDGTASDIDQAESIALDISNNVYITGHTFSSAASFPVLTPIPGGSTLNGVADAFVAKLTLIPTLAIAPTSLDFGIQPIHVTSGTKTVSLTNNTSDAIPFPGTAITFSGTNAADFASSSNTCGASIAAGASCTVSVTFTPSVASAETGTMVITVTITNGGLSSSQAFDVSLKGTGSATAPGVGLAPTNLAFGGQMLTTTSAAKTVTLTNTGVGPLTINSIAASGDFAETSTGATACPISPATLPATAGSNTCIINVTFAPTAVGARAGTLTITDNANGSPHTVPLTGTGWDFTITAPSPQTVGPAAPLKFNATMTPLGGFNQAVALTCTGAPAGTTCVVVSPVTAADGTTAQTAQVTVTTTAMMIPPRSMPNPPLSMRQIVPLILALMLLFMLPRTKRLRVRLGLVTAMLMLVVLAGCGGGGKPPVNATLTITGTSTGTAGSVGHSATVALTIN
jgi:hypothetical protein